MSYFSFEFMLSLVRPFIAKILFNASDEIRKGLADLVRQLYNKAKATDSPYDDLVIIIIAKLLCVDLDHKEKEEEE